MRYSLCLTFMKINANGNFQLAPNNYTKRYFMSPILVFLSFQFDSISFISECNATIDFNAPEFQLDDHSYRIYNLIKCQLCFFVWVDLFLEQECSNDTFKWKYAIAIAIMICFQHMLRCTLIQFAYFVVVTENSCHYSWCTWTKFKPALNWNLIRVLHIRLSGKNDSINMNRSVLARWLCVRVFTVATDFEYTFDIRVLLLVKCVNMLVPH